MGEGLVIRASFEELREKCGTDFIAVDVDGNIVASHQDEQELVRTLRRMKGIEGVAYGKAGDFRSYCLKSEERIA